MTETEQNEHITHFLQSLGASDIAALRAVVEAQWVEHDSVVAAVSKPQPNPYNQSWKTKTFGAIPGSLNADHSEGLAAMWVARDIVSTLLADDKLTDENADILSAIIYPKQPISAAASNAKVRMVDESVSRFRVLYPEQWDVITAGAYHSVRRHFLKAGVSGLLLSAAGGDVLQGTFGSRSVGALVGSIAVYKSGMGERNKHEIFNNIIEAVTQSAAEAICSAVNQSQTR